MQKNLRESDFFCNFARFLHVEIRMKKIFAMIAVCCAMIACTEHPRRPGDGTGRYDVCNAYRHDHCHSDGHHDHDRRYDSYLMVRSRRHDCGVAYGRDGDG